MCRLPKGCLFRYFWVYYFHWLICYRSVYVEWIGALQLLLNLLVFLLKLDLLFLLYFPYYIINIILHVVDLANLHDVQITHRIKFFRLFPTLRTTLIKRFHMIQYLLNTPTHLFRDRRRPTQHRCSILYKWMLKKKKRE